MTNASTRTHASPESPDPGRPDNDGSRARTAARRLGLAAFLFFLIKGLLWLLIPAAVYLWGC